jgi:hypothetical protein
MSYYSHHHAEAIAKSNRRSPPEGFAVAGRRSARHTLPGPLFPVIDILPGIEDVYAGARQRLPASG